MKPAKVRPILSDHSTYAVLKSQTGPMLASLFAALALSTAPAFAFQSEGTVRIGSLEAQTGVPAPYGIQALVGSQIAATRSTRPAVSQSTERR